EAGLKTIDGIQPVNITATSDQIYFGTNGQGAILSIGAVPTGHELRQVPALAVTARGAAGDAHLALDTVKGFDVKYGQEFTTFGQKLDGFGQQLAKFPDATKVGQLERKSNTFELGIGKATKDIAVMQQKLLTHTQQIQVHETKVGAILGTQAQHQAELAVHGAIVTRIDEATTKLDAELTNLGDHLSGRIDQVSGRFDAQAGKLIVGGGREMVVSANASIVGALDAMRIAVEAAAAKTKGVQVRKALAGADPHLSVLRGLVASDTPLTASNADAIAGTVHALFNAVRAAGLSPDSSEYKALDQEVAQLNDALGLPGAPG
ncbi:MAG: hypothetical protein JWM74_4968, partial [Myxococcaceae bacterium]|nr:hypothetical protein [Myxococcaceae bacterium]